MQLLLDRRDRDDSFMRGLKVLARLFRLNCFRFKEQDTRDDLKAVVYPVIHLLE